MGCPSSGMGAERGGIQHKMEVGEEGAGKSPAVESPSASAAQVAHP